MDVCPLYTCGSLVVQLQWIVQGMHISYRVREFKTHQHIQILVAQLFHNVVDLLKEVWDPDSVVCLSNKIALACEPEDKVTHNCHIKNYVLTLNTHFLTSKKQLPHFENNFLTSKTTSSHQIQIPHIKTKFLRSNTNRSLRYFVVLSCGTVYCTIQGGSHF